MTSKRSWHEDADDGASQLSKRPKNETSPVASLVTASWKSSEIPVELPPLPKISNPELERAVFTHRSWDTNEGFNYERLEWLGDAYIETIATNLIFHTFTDLASGKATQIREQLVRNINLKEYFKEYNLGSRAKLPPEAVGGDKRMQEKNREKIYADMFEAYIGALVLSDPEAGFATATEWLKALWGRTIKAQVVQEERRKALQGQRQKSGMPQQEIDPKTRLAQRICSKGIKLKYEDMGNGNKRDRNLNLPLFTVAVHLYGWGETGKLLGIGTAVSKKEAGMKAAEQALQNQKLLKVYEERKRAFEEAKESTAATELILQEGQKES